MDQANIALQIVNALHRRDRDGTEAISASVLAEDVAPKFPGAPVALIHVIAARILAIFYEPLTTDDIKASNLEPAEKADVCDYLASAYQAEVVLLQAEKALRGRSNVTDIRGDAA